MKTNVLLFVVAAVVLFQDRVSLCIPGCPGTSCVVQTGLELTELRHPASLVLGLKAWAITVSSRRQILKSCRNGLEDLSADGEHPHKKARGDHTQL